VKLLRQTIIPIIAFLVLAANTASQQTLRDMRWAVWLGAALIVLAGLLGVGKRWMYFVLPFAVLIFFLILNLWHSYSEATAFFGHRPEHSELAAFIINKQQREYGAKDPYWLTIDVLYFISSYNAGWLYGLWSMLEPGAAQLALKSGTGPVKVGVTEGFRILALIMAGFFLLKVFLALAK
jgi:energy-coupling factor transporter transmembrane protein EcfT